MVRAILKKYESQDVQYHALRTRQAGQKRFVSVHILVPGDWSVMNGHRLCERIETDIDEQLPAAIVFTHLEALEDPASFEDTRLERKLPRSEKSPGSS
ncbi:MAG: cation transporter dimerization domain-containing protein [Verrucomicrobiota bacterium]